MSISRYHKPVINSADEENNDNLFFFFFFLVQTVFGSLDLLNSDDENFCDNKMISAVEDNLLTFPLETGYIQKPIDFETILNTKILENHSEKCSWFIYFYEKR